MQAEQQAGLMDVCVLALFLNSKLFTSTSRGRPVMLQVGYPGTCLAFLSQQTPPRMLSPHHKGLVYKGQPQSVGWSVGRFSPKRHGNLL